MDFSIKLYETPGGRPIVEEELDEIEQQTPELHVLLVAGLSKLKQRENHRPPLCLPVGEGLFELRVGRRNIARALWFFMSGRRIIVVRCFIKKTMKMPPGEIDVARERMNDHLGRQHDE